MTGPELGMTLLFGRRAQGDPPARWLEGPAGGAPRPEPALDPGARRRVSALSACVVEGLGAAALPQPDTLPVVWTTGLGELQATEALLRSLAGGGRARPAAFRGSVHNTAVALLSLAQGLRGPAETLVGGWCTTTAGLLRAVALAQRVGQALLVGGDEGAPVFEAALGQPGALGGAALLLEAGPTAGARVRVGWVEALPPTGRGPLLVGADPWAAPRPLPAGALPLAARFGPTPAAGILALAALVAGGGGALAEPAGEGWLLAEVERRGPLAPGP